jgi:amyloid beta precursor protein binding protein 1
VYYIIHMTDSEKYDRQLRLWGEDGQARLEKAHVCLINGGATGSETLKNLVLPGIGAFTIVDGKKVGPEDLGNNFFLDAQSQGHSRAVRVTELLRELNDRVKGYSVDEDPVALINTKLEFFDTFTIVVACDMPEGALRKLAAHLYERNIPLVIPRSYGFIGYLRIATPEHTIIESKPDNPTDDLRIFSPFAELQAYADSVQLEGMDSAHHSHVPYVVILIKALNKWRSEHDGKAPETRADKDAFKKLITSMSFDISKEENFAEAHKAALKAWTPPSIPDDVQTILRDEKASGSIPAREAKVDEFWVLATALREFVEHEGKGDLPLSGAIPDMASDTTGYIAVQRLYHEKAASDIAAISGRVEDILTKLGRPSSISPDTIKKFCKNARFLKVLRYRSLEQEYTPETAQVSKLASELEAPENNLSYYVLLRAVDRFYATHNRYPGFFDDKLELETDIATLKSFVNSVLSELSLPASSVKDEPIHEMCRFGASEMHNIAAFIGGVASQEIIKLITHQYTPLNNSFIFNGINSTTTTIAL